MKPYPLGAGYLRATEVQPAGYFAALQEEYAAARAGQVVRDFRVAGTLVRLRFAGETLLPSIVSGMAFPVSGPPCNPPLTVCLWDSASTGIPLAAPRRWEDFTGRGNTWGFDSTRYRAYRRGQGSVNGMDMKTPADPQPDLPVMVHCFREDRESLRALAQHIDTYESQRDPEAWVGDTSAGPLRGAMIRKSAFREFGLFPADRFLPGLLRPNIGELRARLPRRGTVE
jgi:hypothetical protein